MPSHLAYLYIALWATLCLAATGLALRDRATLGLFQPAYRRFLLQPWKVATFLVAAGGLTVIAPYTGDFTWDYVDAAFMSILTFLTAPWAVGVYYKAWRREVPLAHAYIALCLQLFSASWSYDLWLFYKLGAYPVMWLANLIASSTLYLAGGLFWNLAWTEARGQYFAFWEPAWPSVSPGSTFSRVALPAFLFMGVIAVVVTAIFLVPFFMRR